MEEGKKKKKFFRTLGAAVLVGLGLGNANAGDKNQDMNAQNADNNSIRFEYIDTSGNRDREELPKVLEAREGKNLPVNNSQMPYKENPQPQIINKENPQNDILNNNIKSRVGNPNAEYPEGGFEEPISEEGLSYIKYNADKFVKIGRGKSRQSFRHNLHNSISTFTTFTFFKTIISFCYC